MVEFTFRTQFAVGQFGLKINGTEQTILHLVDFNDKSKKYLFEKTRKVLNENGFLDEINIESEWRKVCPYF